jgi:lysophospholipase L1-like esterase
MRRCSPIVGHDLAVSREFRPARRAGRILVQALTCGALALIGACGGGDGGPGPDPVYQPPTLACPANIEATANPGQPAVVTYTTPSAANGTPPVTVSCAPGSGASFNLGTSDVACTATDAQSRSASCTFKVTVTEVPQIDKVKFLAFGDSLTEGQVSEPCPASERIEVPWRLLAVIPSESYPTKLQSLLSARYTSQAVSVVNDGIGGKKVASSAEMSRFNDSLSANSPEVLLLLHGFNDLLTAARSNTVDATIPKIAGALEDMVKRAESRGTAVFLANMPAMDASGCRGQLAPYVPEMNDAIRHVAADEGATVVDLYNGLGASPTGVIGIDGLHPTETGYTRMSQVWFESIRQELEKPSATGAAGPVIVVPGDRIP